MLIDANVDNQVACISKTKESNYLSVARRHIDPRIIQYQRLFFQYRIRHNIGRRPIIKSLVTWGHSADRESQQHRSPLTFALLAAAYTEVNKTIVQCPQPA